VIDVLLSEYRTALVRKSYRRVDIDSLCATAKRRLDDERQYPRGVDIVGTYINVTTSAGSYKMQEVLEGRRRYEHLVAYKGIHLRSGPGERRPLWQLQQWFAGLISSGCSLSSDRIPSLIQVQSRL
jgi:hypothetical protein